MDDRNIIGKPCSYRKAGTLICTYNQKAATIKIRMENKIYRKNKKTVENSWYHKNMFYARIMKTGR
jgi:hypothetical protein